MRNEVVIREEPGEYRVVARYCEDGSFAVLGESAHPITLTVRVEDVWERISPELRRLSYSVTVRKDECDGQVTALHEVAPDARIFLDFGHSFKMEFT